MPRDVEHFVPYRILWYCYQQLQKIQRANGYNTDAEIHLSFEDYRNSSAKCAVLVFSDGEGEDDQLMGGGNGSPRVHSRTQITIMASVKYDTELPQAAQMGLEQDIRTALQVSISGARALIGTGVSFRWGETQRMITALSAEREAGMTLSCSFVYPQGSTW